MASKIIWKSIKESLLYTSFLFVFACCIFNLIYLMENKKSPEVTMPQTPKGPDKTYTYEQVQAVVNESNSIVGYLQNRYDSLLINFNRLQQAAQQVRDENLKLGNRIKELTGKDSKDSLERHDLKNGSN